MASDEQLGINYQAQLPADFKKLMDNYQISGALDSLDEQLAQLDKYLTQHKPWLLQGEAKQQVLIPAIHQLLDVNLALQIFMPSTSQTIQDKFLTDQISPFASGLFSRI